MDRPEKLLLISFSCVPTTDFHTAAVTSAVRALNRVFESIDVVAIKGDFLAHIERYHKSRLLRVPLVGETAVERAESFRRAVRRQIDSDGYDVVHVRSPLEGLPVCNARGDKGFRVVYEAGTFAVQDAGAHIGTPDEVAAIEGQLRRDEIACATEADLVIVHSEGARGALQARGVPTPTVVVPHGVNVDLFDWQAPWDAPVPTLLCLGALPAWRDVPTVLEAFRRVVAEIPARLCWAGEPDADKRALVATYAAELGVGDSVSFEGPVEEEALPRLISSSTACIAPAAPAERYVEWGDWPTGLLEGMACRRPVIAARTPGVEEVVRDGTEALFYTPGDPAGLASGISYLLRNPRQAKLLADRGYRRIREQYSASGERRLLLDAYLELLHLDPGLEAREAPGPREEAPLAASEERPSDSVDVVTAIMHGAEETGQIRIEGSDTRRVLAGESAEEASDTHPSIEIKEDRDTASGTWVLPETTPHASTLDEEDDDAQDTGQIKTTQPPSRPPKGEVTSKISTRRRDTDPEPDSEPPL